MRLRGARGATRLTLVIGLLVLTLGIAGVLAWQAHRAAQSHHEAAERVLRDYVGFAGAEFARAARRDLEAATDRWLEAIACGGALPEPAELASRPPCACPEFQPRTLFAVDLVSGRLTSTGQPLGDDVRRWIASFAELPAAERSPARPRVIAVGDFDGERLAVGGRFVRDGARDVVFAGFAAHPQALRPVFARTLAQSPLLPATLAGAGNDLLGVQVLATDGRVLFAAGDAAGAVTVDGILDAAVGGFPYRIALRPDAAGQLIIGGLPRSRLPLLLGLLALTAGLLLVATLQLRREHELSQLRADFVSSVSHELRTPLAQIRLFSETLLLGRVRSEAEGRRSLEIIQQESRRLAHLVENVLYFARAGRGTQAVAAAPTPIATVARDVLETFAPLAQAARAEIRLDAEAVPDVQADPAAVRQILLNLLDNAVKYGPAGQAIAVHVAAASDGVALMVDDQGPGVALEARQRIWQPYARLASAAASGIPGTGIGLAVVADLVALHGGTVRVDDAPGGGARFVVVLPASAAGAQALAGAGAPSSAPA